MAFFSDFLKYILEHKEDPEYDPRALLDIYVNFIEPFAAENDVEIPDELETLVETICELEEEEEAEVDNENVTSEGDEEDTV